LVNGAQGIAVGMATSIPPHNLGEVIDALELLIDAPDTNVATLLKKVKGPDFPTGGELVTSKTELRQIYETGQGTLKVRGEWKTEEQRGHKAIVITSIPYALEKTALVEKIADVIMSKKLPALVDVRDESTEQVRIVLELRRDANPDLVIAYLHKHTPLLSNVQVNLTCLVPSENPDVPTPERVDLKGMLQHFLTFRFDVVQKRLSHDLAELERRLHILEGFEKVFDALDEIIRIIRRSEGKADAASKIMKRFDLDEEQTDAILELKLYRLAKLEILVIQEEANKKRAESKKIRALLGSPKKLWGVVREELGEIRTAYAERRKTRIVSGGEEQEFTAEDFIIDEDAVVIASAQGWVKRQGTVKDLSTTRVKEGDYVLACVAGSTRASVAFFSNLGSCYVARIADVPPSTGYGDPIQKLFKFADGERLIAAYSFDPRCLALPEQAQTADGAPMPPFGIAVTKQGFALRFPLALHKDPSTRAGRRFAKLKDDDEVVAVFPADRGWVVAAASDGVGIAVPCDDVALLAGPGRGTQLLKLGKDASVLGARAATARRGEPLVALTPKGSRYELHVAEVEAPRGGRGKVMVKTSGFERVEFIAPTVPNLSDKADKATKGH
ncbi:MAG: DNA gyrase subunit A, partial [Myxococcota bacterium]